MLNTVKASGSGTLPPDPYQEARLPGAPQAWQGHFQEEYCITGTCTNFGWSWILILVNNRPIPYRMLNLLPSKTRNSIMGSCVTFFEFGVKQFWVLFESEFAFWVKVSKFGVGFLTSESKNVNIKLHFGVLSQNFQGLSCICEFWVN